MNVLFLTHRVPYAPNRGDRIRAYFMLRELSRFANVSVFSLVHDTKEGQALKSLPFARRARGATVHAWRAKLLGAARLATARPLTHSLLDAPGARQALEELVADAPPQVVLAYCSSMAKFALAPPLRDLPLVLDLVDVDSAKWDALAAQSRGLKRWVYAREARTLGAFEAAAATLAEATLVVNEKERRTLLAMAPDAAAYVVENGIDAEAFTPTGPPAVAPVVVFCGVMSYAPNADGVRWFVTHVWPRVRAARPAARFLLVGSDADRVFPSPRDPSIEVIGHVPRVQPSLWNAAVSVAPLHLARGLQNKVLEALAAGLPVVTTSVVLDGLPSTAHAGCVTAEGPEAFSGAVIDLLDRSPDDRRAIAARADLRQLSWPSRLLPLEHLLQQAVASHRA